MSDTYNYEVLEPGGHARLVGNVLDRISRASANPASAVGSSRAILGDPETASWMERTTAADGAALIEAVRGNTVVQDGSLLPVRMEGVETEAADESWSSECTIPASTYFPQGLRSAGSVYDELRADAAVTRVHHVADVSALTFNSFNANSHYITYLLPITGVNTENGRINVTCSKFVGAATLVDGICYVTSLGMVALFCNHSWTTQTEAEAYMAGVEFDYEIATPVVTPIDPPLPMSYRVSAGGTERVMVASGTTSAPPIFATRYPLDPADLAESIAPVDGPIAKTNHQVGDLIMLGFTLCKVTTAIARGEAITIGTNVTQTSVAAEIAALS